MSDYLSNLAARSLGQADVIRPRPVPPFAPPPRVAGWPPVEQADDRESVDRDPRPADPRAPAFQAVAPPADPLSTPQPTVPSLAPPSGWSQLAPPVARPAPPPAAVVAAPALPVGAAQRRPALEPAAEQMIVERLIAPAPTAEQVIVERLIAPAPALAATHAETAPIESVAERIVTPAVRLAPATSVPHVQPLPPSAPAPIVVKPRVASAPAAPAPPQAPTPPAPATPAPAPIIQVTIGRIEVRATLPPSQPARGARPAGPTMSLDEYLRSRSGGSR